MNKVLLMIFSDGLADQYFKYCLPSFQTWCNIQNYDLKIYKEKTINSAPMWMKIKLLYDNINTNYEYLLVMDADMIINNFNLNVLNFIVNNKSIYICKNEANGGEFLNSGSILIKNDLIGKQFVCDVWEQHDKEFANKHWHEQTIINRLYEQKYKEYILPLGMRDLNSHWLCDKNNHPENNVYHFMSRTLSDKIQYVKKHFNIMD